MSVLVDDLTTCINQIPIARHISIDAREGEFIGIIGPNGSGKSTILKSIYRALPHQSGTISIADRDISTLSAKSLAKQMAVVSQEGALSFDFTVEEMVLMGRAPHKKWFDLDSQSDRDIVDHALMQVGLIDKRERGFATLSGGEKQRALIARAISQQAKILILDEPTNHLDIHHQLQVMDLAKSLQLTVISALHDLNIAATYCNRIYVVQDGQIVRSGTPEEVLTAEMLATVFQVNAEIEQHPKTGHIHITYLSAFPAH
ncbi:cobalmin/iron-siderophore abc transporter atpase [Bacillus sp. OxB-1]|uniref:ABC transporter ATP-binding protein n=1 Tax=Bacillus sp. (strain OxB-1) TaxID=98228 RepID=UPI000581BDC5|nr:ABC transporter ATP-binding protein [Bacillus sp. OxB-1]BAQ09705.1 cobalmin/iron-siderophore abc transporter atpase [Bacillus sp. OxB-1]